MDSATTIVQPKGLNLVQKIVILVGVPLLVQVCLYVFLFLKLAEADHERELAAHQKEVVLEFNNVYRMGLMSGKFMTAKRTGVDAKERLELEYVKLENLVRNDPGMLDHVASLKQAIADMCQTSQTLERGSGFSRKHNQVMMMKDLKILARKLSMQLDAALQGAESIHSVSVHSLEQQRRIIAVLLCAGVAFDLGVAAWSVFFVIRRWSSRLAHLMDNTDRVVAGEAVPAPVAGSDEIAQLDQAFFEMARTLADEEEQKQELISTISNDLLAPINSARATIHALETNSEFNESGRKRVQVANRNLERLVQLIDDLLVVERMRTGRLEMNVDVADLALIIKRSADSLRGIAETKSITLILPDTELQVLADKDRMIQVFVNLLSNALKFSASGTTITIGVQERDDKVEIRLADQGKGMSPETLAKIFEPFEQAKDDQKQGTGLGLTICKEIVEQLDGEIRAESELGVGSTFIVVLPSA